MTLKQTLHIFSGTNYIQNVAPNGPVAWAIAQLVERVGHTALNPQRTHAEAHSKGNLDLLTSPCDRVQV